MRTDDGMVFYLWSGTLCIGNCKGTYQMKKIVKIVIISGVFDASEIREKGRKYIYDKPFKGRARMRSSS